MPKDPIEFQPKRLRSLNEARLINAPLGQKSRVLPFRKSKRKARLWGLCLLLGAAGFLLYRLFA